jgi:outer membrane protein OmpA-like peptidoglycan-associated protein
MSLHPVVAQRSSTVSEVSESASSASAQAPGPVRSVTAADIPFVPGLAFGLAVHTPANETPTGGLTNIAQGDYEMVVAIRNVDPNGFLSSVRIEARNENGESLDLTIQRRVAAADLASSRLQIMGFHTDDPTAIEGTTSLGPSLGVMRDLVATGRSQYSTRNFRGLATNDGELVRATDTPVAFPILLNGERVEIPAVRATGELRYGRNFREWEFLLLDHPTHPVTLRFAVGNENAALDAAPPVAVRQVVRINFPLDEAEDEALEESLSRECRVEVPGVYFDFNRDTLDPESNRALGSIAAVLRRQPDWNVAIEGHTDNVGSDAYNLDLSARRAETVQRALIQDFAVGRGRLSAQGFGENRPVETNDTIEGRARNRRVELVRNCP